MTAPPKGQPVVQFARVSKTFADVKAVDNVSFDIHKGEFFSLLGPSGCGKTTTLRLLAGFEEPDEDGGEVRLLGQVVNKKRPYERRVAMVFQNYALFPHLTVAKNVSFGLEQRKTPKAEIGDRVRRALEMVRLKPDIFSGRLPSQLSGGQRQRVALARALVLEPAILLLDEPLGAIDLKLRKEMQLELKALNKQLGTTFIYVTHDQEEALTMSDRIAVMDNARVAQLGTPAEIYENPRTGFVAKFIGESNFFEGRAGERSNGQWVIRQANGQCFRVPNHPAVAEGREVRIAVRPEWMDVWGPNAVPPGENALIGVIREIIYLGETMHLIVTVPDAGDVTVAVRNEGQLIKPLQWKRGDPAAVACGSGLSTGFTAVPRPKPGRCWGRARSGCWRSSWCPS
jgi:spermidine/putrescine ABC transporter ATP-binding subunit